MRRIFPVLLCLLMLLPLCAAAEDNLLDNGDFAVQENGLPVGWFRDAWLAEDGVTYWAASSDGPDGAPCASLENVASNDARFAQAVTVKPRTVYRLSGLVRAEGISLNGAGASLSVVGSYASFPQVWDTGGNWMALECYVRTDIEQTSLVIGARLGDYSADNTGRAWFADLRLEKADAVPEGQTLIELTDYSAYEDTAAEEAPVDEAVKTSVLPLAALAALGMLALWALKNKTVYDPRLLVCLVLVAAFLLRLLLTLKNPGYEADNTCFFYWARWMAQVGPNDFYATVNFCDYPPGYLYLLWPVGGLIEALRLDSVYLPAARVLLRLIPILCDLAAAYLLWRLARRKLGETAAILLCALYAFSPAVFINSAMWGQVDSVMTLGLLLTVLLVSEEKWQAALPVYIVTALMKPQALMAGPLGLAALLSHRGHWRDALKGLAWGLGIALAMVLPFAWGKPVAWIFGQYTATLSSYPYATLNATNLWYLLGMNWVSLDAKLLGVSVGTLGTAFTALSVLFSLWLYLRRREPGRLALCGALCFLLLFCLGTRMHERYVFPALALLLLSYIQRRDARLLAVFAGLSLTLYCNCALVLRDLHLASPYGLPGLALSVLNLLLAALTAWTALDKKTRALPVLLPARKARAQGAPDPFAHATPPMPRMKRRDWIAMLTLTLVYACVAFIGLGSFKAPQTQWTSTGAEETVVFDLGETQTFNVLYYGGISTRNFTLSFSDDGQTWRDSSPAKLDAGLCFCWQYLTQAVMGPDGGVSSWSAAPLVCTGRYARLAANGPSVALMEIVFRTPEGEVLPVKVVESAGARAENGSDPNLLIDEPDTVCQEPSYFNGTYFDEIYHARTGYEHAHGLSTYEWTHPPLGKIFIMLGIKLFGMVPFGWRFFGALTGVLMVPAMYVLGLMLLKKTRWAFLASFVMAFDMMHLSHTRIATIDSYAVFFILLMYLCMFRYLQMNLLRDRYKTLVPLSLCGLFMGLGWACKWICFYSSVGLALLFFWSVGLRVREWRACLRAGGEKAERVRDFPRLLLVTFGVCVGVFIVIPFCIYYFSYIPHFRWEGGLSWKRFWETQASMYSYHAYLVDDHAFQSPWYEWPLILKPMYYFNGTFFAREGNVSAIMCMGNPAVWWAGVGTMAYTVARFVKNALRGETAKDPVPGLLLVGFAAQYLPWVLVPRSMFIYHYFGSLPFVMLSIAYAFSQWEKKAPQKARRAQVIYCGVTLLLFVAFYPISTGTQFPRVWADAVNWFSFLKLPGWKYRGWLYY